jgi:hypothetical protein
MIDLLRPGGPLPEQHASEMEVIENRSRSGVGTFFGTAGASPAETLLSLVLAGMLPSLSHATPPPSNPSFAPCADGTRAWQFAMTDILVYV